ncbi:DUF6077 domain-containing protein [Rhodanobacter geophilus]|uniref:DUF6077 domain-containing protein n=1 Tax=Rhodanobacter geophilus TaxID=3162488 RepID=A0ABV3QR15_9GAMM
MGEPESQASHTVKAATKLSGPEAWGEYLLGSIPVAFIVFYSLWTVYVHLLVLAKASFNALMYGLPFVLASASVVFYLWSRQQHSLQGRLEHPLPFRPALPTATPPWILLVSVAWVGTLTLTHNYVLFWWVATISLGATWWILFANKRAPSYACDAMNRRSIWVLLGLCAVACVVTLVANRPDADDSFYQSIPATILRFPSAPMLQGDTLYRVVGKPIQLPIYKIHTYELAIATVARVLHVPHLSVAYLLFPAFFAALSILCWGRLLRALAPSRWLLVLAALFLCMLALGEAHRSYGNFAFVRMFQGKAIFACVAIPCVIYHALQYSRCCRPSDWMLLAAAQIAAIGITSSGLFVVPFAAALALSGSWSANFPSTRRLLLGLLASFYVIAVGCMLIFVTHGGKGFVSDITMPSMYELLIQVFGAWSVAILLTALISAWAFAETTEQSKFLLTGSFCFLLLVLNPYSYQFLGRHLTGTHTYWRLAWAFPLPILLALLLVGVSVRIAGLRSKALTIASGACASVGAVIFFMHAGTLRSANFVTLGAPAYKVPTGDYAAARVLAGTPEQGIVLAPEPVATWIPIFVTHPQILGTRIMYLSADFAPMEAAQRRMLMTYVGGSARAPDSPAVLESALTRYNLSAIMVARDAPWVAEIRNLLAAHGWHNTTLGHYELWRKPETPRHIS